MTAFLEDFLCNKKTPQEQALLAAVDMEKEQAPAGCCGGQSACAETAEESCAPAQTGKRRDFLQPDFSACEAEEEGADSAGCGTEKPAGGCGGCGCRT